jgi:hypothetical protein
MLPDKDRARERARMVEHQLIDRGIRDQRLLNAFLQVPREAFVDESVADLAYEDSPLPIGEGQTISQPYVVALMIEALDVRPGDRVLEVGVGRGSRSWCTRSSATRTLRRLPGTGLHDLAATMWTSARGTERWACPMLRRSTRSSCRLAAPASPRR